MSSYQNLKAKNKELKEKLNQAEEFERMMKNLLNAIEFNKTEEIYSYRRWFLKNTKRYHKSEDSNRII